MNRSDYKDRILAAIPIETYVGRFVSLKKQGKSFKGLCPFHREKTPSFLVTPDKGIYHCFGCGKGGDIFSFTMEIEGVEFREALDILGRYAGIEKPDYKKNPAQEREKHLVDLNALVMQAFSDYLKEQQAEVFSNYIYKQRGIKESTSETFRLGASPDSWQWLEEKIPNRTEDLIELGLIKEGSKGKPYDFYRGRVIFPILDGRGQVVGFGGRILPGSENPAKYLNAPESKVFHKSNVLYGFYQGQNAIREKKECVVTEGYLDVIGLHQAGVKNVVAPMGTAMSANHLKLIKRYADKLVLLLDGDNAGRNAALRFARLLVDHGGMSAAVVLLPAGKDPFDLAADLNLEQLDELLQIRIPSERYLILETMFPAGWTEMEVEAEDTPVGALNYCKSARDYYQEAGSFSWLSIDLKRAAINRLFEFIRTLESRADQSLFLAEGARTLNLSAGDLEQEFSRGNQGVAVKRRAPEPPPRPPQPPVMNHFPDNSSDSGEFFDGPPAGEDYGGFEDFEDYGSGSSAPAPVRSQAESRFDAKLLRCENELLAELILAPHVIGRFLEPLNNLEFQGYHAEIIWRNMESRFQIGEVWTADTFMKSELPAEALAVVSTILVKKSEVLVTEKKESLMPESALLVGDLLDIHRKLLIEKEIEKINQELPVADMMEREFLIQKYDALLKEKRNLEYKS